MYKKIRLDYKTLFVNFVKMIFAGCLTFGICYYVADLFNSLELPKYIFETTKIVVVMILCASIYTILNLFFKMDYAKELVNRVLKK